MEFFAEIAANDPQVGGKARSLAELGAAGLGTPAGFVVGDALFRALCPDLEPIARLDQDALGRLDELRAQLMRRPWPASFLDELEVRLDGLRAARFAIRSSFAAEDVPGRLAAGVYESRVGLAAEAVPAAIREVLASALAPGAVAYGLGHGLPPTGGPFAVLVHGYVPGEAEGSAALVPGREVTLAVRRGELPAGARAEIEAALGALAARRGPVEIEWVWSDGRLIYLQARPYEPPPAAAPWSGWAALRPSEPPPSAWRWDAAHNPLPLSPAQAGLVELVDRACVIGIRQRVLGGYLFYARDDRPLPAPIACEAAPGYFAELEARVVARLGELGPEPALEAALALFQSAYEAIFGVLQPALRGAHARLHAFLAAHAPDGLARLPTLRLSVPSVASDRLGRAGKLSAATSAAERAAALAAYLARFGDEAPVWDVAEPTYAEAPDLLRPRERVAPEHDQRWHAASDAIARTLPARLRAEWTVTLELARNAVALGEADDWLYAKTQAAVRRALLAEGRRWTGRGALSDVADVFFLPLGTARGLAAANSPPSDLGEIARAGRREWEAARRNPPALPSSGDAKVVSGVGVGGRAIGRVARHFPGDPAALAKGAVLVAQTLLPTELPLVDAAALVIETGGALDHVAAQARERKLPAVVGATGALALLHDGDLVVVDGERGLIVRL